MFVDYEADDCLAKSNAMLPLKANLIDYPQMRMQPVCTHFFYVLLYRWSKLYRPERWIELESMPSPYSYLSFNAGARMCLGQRLAELEGVFVLAGLLSRFKLRQKEPGKKITYQVAITMPMKDGLSVYVQHRAKE